MSDREKVIKGLECCLQTDDVIECRIIDCPYHHYRDICTEWLMKDALELLKEQEPVNPCSDCQEFVCNGCKYAKGGEVG